MSTRGPYRFEGYPGGSPYGDESTCVIDEAIVRAGEIARREKSAVAVVDTSERGRRHVRGVAKGKQWHWSVKCSPCKGTGKVTKKGVEQACDRCGGKGWRPDGWVG